MRHEVAIRRIESFGKRFGPSRSHLYLAYHAAFPLALTPDLLYRIWANFQRDVDRKLLNIPWIAVADLLLSNLCGDVGHELYEMDVAVRNELLKQLKEDPRFGEKRINDLSNFLLAYVRKDLNSSESDRRDFAQSQRWTALAYKDSEQAARELALAFNQAYQQDRAELVRLATLTEILAQPVEEFEKLLIYARAMGHYARKRLEDAKNQVSSLSIKGRLVSISGVDLPIPLELIADEVEKEQKRHFLWQQGNTKIYSLCTDEPWTLPFDALVIPVGIRVGFGMFAQSLINFLGENSIYLYDSINKAKREMNKSTISPNEALLIALPSEINNQLFPSDTDQLERFIICATVESPEILVVNAGKATQSVIKMTTDIGITRLVLPLLGTGINGLPISHVAIAMFSAIVESLNNLSPNPLKEIIFVDKNESTIEIINQVAHSLFAQKNIDDVQLLSAQGIDYTQLRDLLAEGKWKEADQETAKVMLQASGQEERGWLDKEDMEKIPSIDLQTIDQLWLKYSNGKFRTHPLLSQLITALAGFLTEPEQLAQLFQEKLKELASRPDFTTQMGVVFGEGNDYSQLQSGFVSGILEGFPRIEVCMGAEFRDANAAYVTQTNTIIFSENFLRQNGNNLQVVNSVLLEELGHFIDAKVNFSDPPGDEGELFCKIVQGIS